VVLVGGNDKCILADGMANSTRFLLGFLVGLVQAGLARVLARLRPVLTYKTRWSVVEGGACLI
jgi:hypothetical protein